MNHTEALRLQAVEKYLLNELNPSQREEYEEHYFDCPICAEDLKAAVALMEGSRQLFKEGAFQPAALPNRAAEPARERKPGWFAAFLRPAFAVPVFAALLLFIGYQNSVTIPNLKQSATSTATADVAKYLELLPAGARGDGASLPTIQVHRMEKFSVHVDMPGNSADGYVCQIQDQSGRVEQTLRVSSEEAKRFVQIDVPGGSLGSGKYNLVIFKGQEVNRMPANAEASARSPFAVEIIQ